MLGAPGGAASGRAARGAASGPWMGPLGQRGLGPEGRTVMWGGEFACCRAPLAEAKPLAVESWPAPRACAKMPPAGGSSAPSRRPDRLAAIEMSACQSGARWLHRRLGSLRIAMHRGCYQPVDPDWAASDDVLKHAHAPNNRSRSRDSQRHGPRPDLAQGARSTDHSSNKFLGIARGYSLRGWATRRGMRQSATRKPGHGLIQRLCQRRLFAEPFT